MYAVPHFPASFYRYVYFRVKRVKGAVRTYVSKHQNRYYYRLPTLLIVVVFDLFLRASSIYNLQQHQIAFELVFVSRLLTTKRIRQIVGVLGRPSSEAFSRNDL